MIVMQAGSKVKPLGFQKSVLPFISGVTSGTLFNNSVPHISYP